MKGLFCGVPAASLERLVVHGVGEGGGLARNAFTEAGFHMPQSAPPPAPAPAPAARQTREGDSEDDDRGGDDDDDDDESGGGGGPAQRCVRDSPPVPFPRSFSRHSTLEEDRAFVASGGAGDDGDDLEEEEPPQQGVGGGRRAGARTGAEEWAEEENGADGLGPGLGGGRGASGDKNTRFLALCRVLIGQIFVTSKAHQGASFPDDAEVGWEEPA